MVTEGHNHGYPELHRIPGSNTGVLLGMMLLCIDLHKALQNVLLLLPTYTLSNSTVQIEISQRVMDEGQSVSNKDIGFLNHTDSDRCQSKQLWRTCKREICTGNLFRRWKKRAYIGQNSEEYEMALEYSCSHIA